MIYGQKPKYYNNPRSAAKFLKYILYIMEDVQRPSPL